MTQERKYLIIHVACPFDTRVKENEKDKVEKYQDLKMEIKRFWQCNEVKVISIINGTLGTVSMCFKHRQKNLEVTINFSIIKVDSL